jgi:proteasome lid subunit RPN8/RPN11
MSDLNFIQKLIKTHAEHETKNECCGLIGLNAFQELQVIPCENTHFDKENFFEISPKSYVEKSKGLQVCSIYHSHIISSSNPSEYDKISSENWCLPFYIYSLKDKSFYLHFPKNYKIPSLEDRTYIPDVQNCFRFVVDYYFSKGYIKYFDLNFALMKSGQAYSKKTIEIIKTFVKANGFKKINEKEEIKEHDLILFEIDGLFSHFGVFCGDDEIWHHEGNFLSRKSHVSEELNDRIHSVYRVI